MRRPEWRILIGDALEVLRALPDRSVHSCISSPPYHAVRRYKGKRPLGAEDTPEEWAANVAKVYREVHRVLRDDGTCWVNIGDSWWGTSSFAGSAEGTDGVFSRKAAGLGKAAGSRRARHPWLKPGDLVDQAAFLGEAMVKEGWYRRARIVWARTNPVPDSAKNRPGSSHEYVLLMTKRQSGYFYDHTAVREESVDPGKDRNRRSVWSIAAEKAMKIDGVKHTSAFPRELVRLCLAAGTSERGACPDCGAPWERRLSKPKGGSTGKAWHDHEDDPHNGNAKKTSSKDYVPAKTVGWRPTCKCPRRKEPVPARILDPFSGSATTGVVCLTWGRDYTGVEMDPVMARASEKRLLQAEEENAMPLFASAQTEMFGGAS